MNESTKQPIKMIPGDELHLTALMAPFSLNLVTGQDRQHLLGYGRAAFEAGQKTTAAGHCLHQIQEPAAAEQAAWHAGLDEGRAQAAGSVSNATSQAAPAAVAVPDERAAFEAWADARKEDSIYLPKFSDGTYINDDTHAAWEAWQARAALAATPAAVQTHAEAAAALCINSALTRIRAGNHAEAIEPLEHALRALGTTTAAAVPVVLPEPDAWLAVYEDRDGNSKFYTSTHKDLAVENDTNGKPQPLYTEQKVSALLAGVSAPAAQAAQHPDEAAVDALAALMKAKLAKQRAKGYGGWDTDCTRERLSELLRGHVDKGDPVDVANFCAFLSARGEGIAPQAQADARDAEWKKVRLIGAIGMLDVHVVWDGITESPSVSIKNGHFVGDGGATPISEIHAISVFLKEYAERIASKAAKDCTVTPKIIFPLSRQNPPTTGLPSFAYCAAPAAKGEK